MRIRRLEINNYRGIKSAIWMPTADLVCLIGPGDSTKTTLLDAISLALTPRFSIELTDVDFHNCDLSEPIKIEVVVSDVPEKLLSFDKLGGFVCGVNADGEVLPDPEESSEKALAIRFTADQSLEPIWEVHKPFSDLEPKRLSAANRAVFGLFRVDERVDAHMRWTRGSALSTLTGGTSQAESASTTAMRAAREAVFGLDDPQLIEAASLVGSRALKFGASNYENLRPGIDPVSMSSGHALTLHEDKIPLTRQGLGTRRLTSLAIQDARVDGASIILIDEIELGLEPHRLHRLVRLLHDRVKVGGAQVIMTTHSPLVVEQLDVSSLALVRNAGGITSIKAVPSTLDGLDSGAMQKMVRSGPSAMLASRVIVVEGATEMGLLRAFCEAWDAECDQKGREPLAVIGTAVRNGGSDKEALKRGECLALLGFDIMIVVDHDNILEKEEKKAAEAGAEVVRWETGNHLEAQIAADIPADQLYRLIDLVAELTSEESVLASIAARLPSRPGRLSSTDPREWPGRLVPLRRRRHRP
ncbi:ATP-dependent nuclease [Candidatus Protofrankia californiensis]|uniref:ATP-dependent nuclease n=1 Tax=Candidatus Protofrankia californiensis TaxID=1839754 RepID=UPI0010415861|nr:ATP-binding protein [Candidatus Protofrankia californiensis]